MSPAPLRVPPSPSENTQQRPEHQIFDNGGTEHMQQHLQHDENSPTHHATAPPHELGNQGPEVDDNDDTETEDMQEQFQSDANGPTHHPPAPPDEVFDVPTTVDPSYIISLICKLLPVDDRRVDDIQELAPFSPTRNGDMNGSTASNGVVVDMDCQDDDLKQSREHSECPTNSTREEAWEESGCILWDLAANKEHAEFMVQNLVVDVLLANLLTTDSTRVTEISLGIIGNLACHEVVMNQMTATNRFLETITNQVFSDDTPCLCEVCRLLTLGLQGCQSMVWAKALEADSILSRILWIAENTLNPTLSEKSVELLLAIMENEQVAPALLPSLVKLGLPSLLVNLLTFDLRKLTGDRMPERYPVLASILRAIETLSVIDDYSEEICSKKEVAQMAVELIKFPEKTEISNSCVTAAVLIANILSDAPHLALELSKDLLLLQSLLDLLPFTSDDLEARNALWSVLARLLLRVKDIEMSSFSLYQYVSALVGKSSLIEDALLDSEWDRPSENNEMLTTSEAKLNSKTSAIKCICNILDKWKLLKEETSECHGPALYVDDKDVQKLLDCCHKHES